MEDKEVMEDREIKQHIQILILRWVHLGNATVGVAVAVLVGAKTVLIRKEAIRVKLLSVITWVDQIKIVADSQGIQTQVFVMVIVIFKIIYYIIILLLLPPHIVKHMFLIICSQKKKF